MRRGMGTVVAVMVIALLAIVGAAIFLGAFLKDVRENTSDESAFCLGIDLEVNSCIIIPQSIVEFYSPPASGPALLINVERFPGGGDVTGLNFIVKDGLGDEHVHQPINLIIPGIFEVNTNYSIDLVEYASVNAVVRDLLYAPDYVSVGAVVGKSKTICAPIRAPIKCNCLYPGAC